MEEHIRQRAVKREETGGNDPENGSPGGDGGGKYSYIVYYNCCGLCSPINVSLIII